VLARIALCCRALRPLHVLARPPSHLVTSRVIGHTEFRAYPDITPAFTVTR
jgi:hypothetical protein